MQERAALIIADLSTQVSRTVLRCAKLGPAGKSVKLSILKERQHLPKNSVTVHRTIDRGNTSGSSVFAGICHIHANALVDGSRLCFADNDFLNFAILAEVFVAS